MSPAALALTPHSDRSGERALIERVISGDRNAGRVLYDAHAARVFRVAFRMTGDEALAQDFTQETFIKAFAQLGTFRGESSLATWLHRIAFTVTANGMRKVKRLRTRETVLDDASGVHHHDHECDPDLKVRLYEAIEALPEIYRTTLVLHSIEGFTHAEIAVMQGVAEGTCKSRLSVARGMLREALADFAKNEE